MFIAGKDQQKSEKELFLERYNKRMTRAKSAESKLKKMFKDDHEEKDHHQAMTALILWFVLIFCWVW
jgi:hypothetical protein